jgi:multidrug resistance efflux pump
MRGKWLLFAAFAVVAGIGGGALSHRLRKAPPAAPESAAVVAKSNEISLPGTVRAQHVVNVGAEIEGNIEAFSADVGDEVFEGQVLARIGSAGLETSREQASAAVESAQQQVGSGEAAVASARLEASRADADMQRAKVQMEAAQKVFDRQTTLNQHGATPKLKYEASVRDFEAAMKEFEIMDKAARAAQDGVKTANDKLAKAKQLLAEKGQDMDAAQGAFASAELRAPTAGTIVARKGEPGKSARDYGNDLFQIATDLFSLEVAADANPEQIKKIHPGQEALVLLVELGSAGMPGRVKEIKDNQAIVEFNSSVPAVRPGMHADVRVKLD